MIKVELADLFKELGNVKMDEINEEIVKFRDIFSKVNETVGIAPSSIHARLSYSFDFFHLFLVDLRNKEKQIMDKILFRLENMPLGNFGLLPWKEEKFILISHEEEILFFPNLFQVIHFLIGDQTIIPIYDAVIGNDSNSLQNAIKSRELYLQELAQKYNIDYSIVEMLSDILLEDNIILGLEIDKFKILRADPEAALESVLKRLEKEAGHLNLSILNIFIRDGQLKIVEKTIIFCMPLIHFIQ